jgi:hypothetical protein
MVLPDDQVSLWTAVAVILLPAALLVLNRVITPAVDATEPPVVSSTIPIIGHLIGMLTEKGSWYRRLQ